jgi:hypothetical protein
VAPKTKDVVVRLIAIIVFIMIKIMISKEEEQYIFFSSF